MAWCTWPTTARASRRASPSIRCPPRMCPPPSSRPGFAASSRCATSVRPLEPIFVELPHPVAKGEAGAAGALHDFEAVVGRLTADDPTASVAALRDALEAGVVPTALSQALCYAAALRVARFHTSNEF